MFRYCECKQVMAGWIKTACRSTDKLWISRWDKHMVWNNQGSDCRGKQSTVQIDHFPAALCFWSNGCLENRNIWNLSVWSGIGMTGDGCMTGLLFEDFFPRNHLCGEQKMAAVHLFMDWTCMDQSVQFPALKYRYFSTFSKFSLSFWFPVKGLKLKRQSAEKEMNRKSVCHPSGPEMVREYIATLCDRPATILTANNSQDLTAQVLLLKPCWGKDNTFHQVSVTLVSVVRLASIHHGFCDSQSCRCQVLCIYTIALGFRISSRRW